MFAVTVARNDIHRPRLAQKDVLSHVKLRNETQLLAHKSDAQRQRVTRTLDLDGAECVDLDDAFVRRHNAEQDLHQR